MWFCLEQRITIIDLEFETIFELLENSCIDHDLDMSIALIDSAFNDTLWNIATGDLTTVQDAEKDFEERLGKL